MSQIQHHARSCLFAFRPEMKHSTEKSNQVERRQKIGLLCFENKLEVALVELEHHLVM